MSIFCVIGVPMSAFLLLPYFIPAVMCVIPYYVGVLALARPSEGSPTSKHVTHLSSST